MNAMPKRPARSRLLTLAITLATALSACFPSPDATPTVAPTNVVTPTDFQPPLEKPLAITLTGSAPGDMVDTEWRLVAIPGVTLPENNPATLEIRAERIGGYSGCNWYGGAYVPSTDGFAWAQPVMTLRLCDQSLMTVEQAFQDRLTTALTWNRDGDRLELRDSAGSAQMIFERRVPAAVSANDLIGRWEWVGDTAAPTRPWIAFDGARFVGHTGCRDFTGDYTTERDRLHFNSQSMPQTECSTAGATLDVEQPVINALDSVVYFRLESGDLILETTTRLTSRWARVAADVGTPTPGGSPGTGVQTVRLTGVAPADFVGTSWTLTTLPGGPDLSGAEVTLTIGATSLGGNAGCNNYGGDYAASGTDLVIQPLVSTLMLCAEPVGSIETTYLTAFTAAREWRVSAASLEFRDAAGNVLATFAASSGALPTPVPGATSAPPVATSTQPQPAATFTPTVIITPTISSFTVSPTTAERGQTLTLTWESSNGITATLQHRDPNNWWGTQIAGDFPVSGQAVISDTTKDEGVTAFILTVYGQGGGWAQQEVTVTFPCLETFFFTTRDLGACPFGPARPLSMVQQNFEHGIMVWIPHQTGGTILVLYDGGRIGTFTDTWTEGQPESDPSIVPPADLFAPRRGFGKVWREQPGVRDALGWAFFPETPVSSQTQARSTGGDWKAIDYYFRLVDNRIVHITGRTMPGGWEIVEP